MVDCPWWLIVLIGFFVVLLAALLSNWEANRVTKDRLNDIVDRLDRQRVDITQLRMALSAYRIRAGLDKSTGKTEDKE